jgi:hypothetical protein
MIRKILKLLRSYKCCDSSGLPTEALAQVGLCKKRVEKALISIPLLFWSVSCMYCCLGCHGDTELHGMG